MKVSSSDNTKLNLYVCKDVVEFKLDKDTYGFIVKEENLDEILENLEHAQYYGKDILIETDEDDVVTGFYSSADITGDKFDTFRHDLDYFIELANRMYKAGRDEFLEDFNNSREV